MYQQAEINFAPVPPLLVVAYGAGVDSTAMLVGYWRRGIRPDLILFADVGAERQSTYDYLPKMNAWLRAVGFPEVTTVKYRAKDFKHWPAYHTLEENILTNVSLPALAYGGHTCSSKWKISAQEKYLRDWTPARESWAAGRLVTRAVGFEDSPHEHKRAKRCATFAIQDMDAGKYETAFPLQEWGWDRDECVRQIIAAGLDVPDKSSCYFCPAMKPREVDTLPADKLQRIVILEARTVKRHLDFAEKKGWPKGVGVPLTEGLWRQRVKGMRGATPKPGSMTEYIWENGLLPAPLVDALQELTPTNHFTQADFDAAGVADWQQWLDNLCERAQQRAALTA